MTSWISSLTLSRATIFECMSSRFVGAHVGGHMTGPSVRTLIPARKLAEGTPGNTTIQALLVRSFVREVVIKVIRASSHMEFSNAGFTRLATELNHAKMDSVVAGESVSLLTRRSNFVFCLNKVRVPMGLLLHRQLRF